MSDEPQEQITLRGTEFTVSATEKVSTGEYENYSPHVSLKGDIPAPESELNPDTRDQVRRELIALHDDLQSVLETTIDRRLSVDQPNTDELE